MDFLEVATLYKRIYDAQKSSGRLTFARTRSMVQVPVTPHRRRIETVQT